MTLPEDFERAVERSRRNRMAAGSGNKAQTTPNLIGWQPTSEAGSNEIMDKNTGSKANGVFHILNRMKLKLRPKLILIFLVAKVIPIVLLTTVALNQIIALGTVLREMAVHDSSIALNDGAIENIEQMTTNLAASVADFLYQRDADIRSLALMPPTEEVYRSFSDVNRSALTQKGEWVVSDDGMSWVESDPYVYNGPERISSNEENNDEVNESSFHYLPPTAFAQKNAPLYDEIAFIELDGTVRFQYISPDSPKINYPIQPIVGESIADQKNTYIQAETYYEELKALQPGEIYVSDVIGAYTPSQYIGMYTKDAMGVAKIKAAYAPLVDADGNATTGNESIVALLKQQEADLRGLPQLTEIIEKLKAENEHELLSALIAELEAIITNFNPEKQAYAGKENPNGQRFEGIVRWATPVTDERGAITGYVTFALNHDHIMEFVDYITPMKERYTPLPDALNGNYAFIWDYQCRSICHPRHHSIVGYDAQTGEPQIPWLETSTYEAWKQSGMEKWTDFIAGLPTFHEQSRAKRPAAELTAQGLVGLDGRYLDNAPQCTGWMDLTEGGGSGSFWILWSGLYKLTTAAAIPYYTGQYAPENQNGSMRGFAMVTIGAGIEDFTAPAQATGERLTATINGNLGDSAARLIGISAVLVVVVILIAILLSSYLTSNIKVLINGISRFRSGQRQYRVRSDAYDEFGTLAKSFDEMADSIVDSVRDSLVITDMDCKIIYANDTVLEIWGCTSDEIIGQSYDKVSLYERGSKYDPLVALHENRESEVLFSEKSGHYYKGTANYLLDQNGAEVGYIIMSSDVTEIEDARKRAEQANHAKSSFLSNMSHEMRTPMNAIVGMTAIGVSAPDMEKKDYAFRKIHDASTHLLGVINDILDMSKIEASKFTLSFTEFEFEKMIQRIVDVINFRVDEKHQKLTVYIDPEIPRELVGDDQRIAQVITNLLTNAVKFTGEEGSIHLEAKLSSEENGMCTLLFSVKDTGIGISAEHRGRLFTAFEQAEASTTRKYGGTGLGLVISRNIVEMMGGEMWVDSKLGKGSDFSFTVCLARGNNKPKRFICPGLNMGNTRMLAVDDDPDVRAFFEGAGQQIGITCDTAAGGAEALSLIDANGVYSIYFVDWNMPEMSGIDLARQIREKDTEDAIVIIISAVDWNMIQDDAQAAGIHNFISKPLFISSIVDSINGCLGVPEAADGLSKEAGKDFNGYSILLAEDVEINREIVLALLEPTGVQIDCAVNGVEAVEMFASNPQKYGAIFMDVQMPEMDGFAATKAIRESGIPRAKDIPIVAMTANVFKEDIDRCLVSGMNEHVGKPLNMDEVIGVLEKYLKSN